jgi:hypothetical protein
MVKLLCWAISSPRSQVNERRNAAGSCCTCWLKAATTVPVSLPDTFMSVTKRELRSTSVTTWLLRAPRPCDSLPEKRGEVFHRRTRMAQGEAGVHEYVCVALLFGRFNYILAEMACAKVCGILEDVPFVPTGTG